MTNNEHAAAHRILQKHGIEHKLQGHRLPLTSNEFAIEIAGWKFEQFADVKSYLDHKSAKFADAATEIAEAVRRDANADKP
jgi:hypothetical protein